MRKLLAAFALAALGTQGEAADVPRIDLIDFVVDWQKYVGRVVILTGGVVNFADSTSAILYKPGASIMILAPYLQKEDMRYILKNCTGVAQPLLCTVDVAGVVDSKPIGNNPVLRSADFGAPSK